MYDFGKINFKVSLTKEFILKRVDEVTIFYYYFGKFELGKAYKSKFTKDRNPSTGFYISKSGQVKYRDFRSGQSWDCFSFVQQLRTCNFDKALQTIAYDFGLIDRNTSKVSDKILQESKELDKECKKQTLIQFIPGVWDKRHLDYWRLYEVSQEELERENVHPVKRLFVNKKEILNFHDELRFAYPEQYEDKVGVKIYSPYDTKMKWISSLPLDVPFGLNNLSYDSDTILIAKSNKDRIVLKKLFKSVIATQNESYEAFPSLVQELALNRFKRAIVVYGADDQGVEACKKFNSKGFGYFNTPRYEYVKHGIEDPADYVKFYGLDALKELFKNKNLL